MSATQVWGLTGGIGSGKSTVARHLKSRGAEILDADQIAREISQPGGSGHALLIQEFGTADRNVLAQKVFADPQARKKIEALLHPLIIAESKRRIEAFKAKSQPPFLILYEASLLLETGRDNDFDGILVVTAPEPQRIARVRTRDATSELAVQARIAAQMSDADRSKRATRVIVNNGSEADLIRTIDTWLHELGLAK